jgi:hypothetical protein
MWYRHADTKDEVEQQMKEFYEPAMAWAEATLKRLKKENL